MIGARSKAVAVLVLLLGATFTGCLGFFGDDDTKAAEEDLEQKRADELLGDEGTQRLEEVAQAPRNYTFPGQEALASKIVFFNDTIGTQSNGAIEGQRDEGGIDFNGVIKTYDLSSDIPDGQPVELFLKLYWDGKEGASADLDLYVDVPGTKTSYSTRSEAMNWNFATKTMTVNTVGVSGANHLVGVKANNGRTTEDIPFSVRIELHYAKDVLTPAVPYAFDVPENASGIIVESDKVAGEQHINASFVVIDPNDELVKYTEYNDLAIASESYFIPVNGPGEYVFYAQHMEGGFLKLKADYPLENLQVRKLDTREEVTVDASGATPGIVGRNWGEGGAVSTGDTPMQGAQETSFDVAGTFPLEVRGFIGPGNTAMSQIRIESPSGLIYESQRVASHSDDQGNNLGYTRDEANTFVDFSKLAKGTYAVKVVNDGDVEVGHTVLTYVR